MSELRQKTDGAEVANKGTEVAKDGRAKAEVQKKAAKDESRENIEID